MVSPTVERRLWGTQASVVAARGLNSFCPRTLEHRLNSCGAQTWLLPDMWDLLRPGIEPMSPTLADGFTTGPPGKPQELLI